MPTASPMTDEEKELVSAALIAARNSITDQLRDNKAVRSRASRDSLFRDRETLSKAHEKLVGRRLD